MVYLSSRWRKMSSKVLVFKPIQRKRTATLKSALWSVSEGLAVRYIRWLNVLFLAYGSDTNTILKQNRIKQNNVCAVLVELFPRFCTANLFTFFFFAERRFLVCLLFYIIRDIARRVVDCIPTCDMFRQPSKISLTYPSKKILNDGLTYFYSGLSFTLTFDMNYNW